MCISDWELLERSRRNPIDEACFFGYNRQAISVAFLVSFLRSRSPLQALAHVCGEWDTFSVMCLLTLTSPAHQDPHSKKIRDAGAACAHGHPVCLSPKEESFGNDKSCTFSEDLSTGGGVVSVLVHRLLFFLFS